MMKINKDTFEQACKNATEMGELFSSRIGMTEAIEILYMTVPGHDEVYWVAHLSTEGDDMPETDKSDLSEKRTVAASEVYFKTSDVSEAHLLVANTLRCLVG